MDICWKVGGPDVATISQGACFYLYCNMCGSFNAKENNGTKQNKQNRTDKQFFLVGYYSQGTWWQVYLWFIAWENIASGANLVSVFSHHVSKSSVKLPSCANTGPWFLIFSLCETHTHISPYQWTLSRQKWCQCLIFYLRWWIWVCPNTGPGNSLQSYYPFNTIILIFKEKSFSQHF